METGAAKHIVPLHNRRHVNLVLALSHVAHLLRHATVLSCSNYCHISLEQNLTIRSHDGGKGGHFCNCHKISIHLQSKRSVPLVGHCPLSKFTVQ